MNPTLNLLHLKCILFFLSL